MIDSAVVRPVAPLVGLVRSKDPAAIKLVNYLVAKAPVQLAPHAIVAACTPEAAATALKLLESYPSAVRDAASIEPLLANDCAAKGCHERPNT